MYRVIVEEVTSPLGDHHDLAWLEIVIDETQQPRVIRDEITEVEGDKVHHVRVALAQDNADVLVLVQKALGLVSSFESLRTALQGFADLSQQELRDEIAKEATSWVGLSEDEIAARLTRIAKGEE